MVKTSSPEAEYDVPGLGCTAVDDLPFVAAYPAADAKVQVRRRERQCGGLAALAAGEAAPRHQPAFRVEVADTTGCGDVFHGAYASALARGLGLAERVRFASAAAALKATRPGGQAGIPLRAAVESFLHDSPA